jgi:hypothetical protein
MPVLLSALALVTCWARRMGIRANHYVPFYHPRQPVERGGHHHDSPGIVHGIYRCRRYCDLH